MFIYLIGPIYFFIVLSRVAWLTGLCHGNLDILTTKVRIYNSAFATLGILKSEASHFKSNRTWTWTRKFLPLTHSICISQRWGASKKEIWNETFIDNLLSATISRTNKLKQQKLVLPSLSLPTTISLSHTLPVLRAVEVMSEIIFIWERFKRTHWWSSGQCSYLFLWTLEFFI